MTFKIITRPLALKSILDLADHVAKDNVPAAIRLLDAFEESCRFLADHPHSGEKIDEQDPTLAGYRIWQVRGFPSHLIVFRSVAGAIEIVHAFHAARDLSAVVRELASQE